MKPTAEATYERARRLANVALWTIDLQCRRLQTEDPRDKEFVLRRWADFDFLIVALTRLRRAAKLAAGISEAQKTVLPALGDFDAKLPFLKKLRDVAEHIDDYALDKGRMNFIQRQALEVSSMSIDGSTLHWLGHSINCNEALETSQKLFDAVKAASEGFSRRAQQVLQADGPASGGPVA